MYVILHRNHKCNNDMVKLKLKPYTFLSLSEYESDNRYRIVKYNPIKEDWDILDGIYTDKKLMLQNIEELNQEAGTITISFE